MPWDGSAIQLKAGWAAGRALNRVGDQFDGQQWNDLFELLAGNADIGLGVRHAGDLDLAVTAVTPCLATADRTPCGVNWAVRCLGRVTLMSAELAISTPSFHIDRDNPCAQNQRSGTRPDPKSKSR
ncbi:MAG TPA: hypothetical protein VMA73_12580 [Streptosporangiaceae bacterium]|nr:hypothetical protein [Streptosporangiaceae bacterium]